MTIKATGTDLVGGSTMTDSGGKGPSELKCRLCPRLRANLRLGTLDPHVHPDRRVAGDAVDTNQVAQVVDHQ
ncbi:hypothetical protein GCM10009557_56750 [Virgisporangium ochraceum]|uniref:Uncharacterized protein n=1 Tax=Virgisporangium ochraceum TaxID=65505 RepID=A0A8J4EBK6_9ACTN|nr:hypothetical protein Voc01_035960 [Virgisporangium ochraceum]